MAAGTLIVLGVRLNRGRLPSRQLLSGAVLGRTSAALASGCKHASRGFALKAVDDMRDGYGWRVDCPAFWADSCSWLCFAIPRYAPATRIRNRLSRDVLARARAEQHATAFRGGHDHASPSRALDPTRCRQNRPGGECRAY